MSRISRCIPTSDDATEPSFSLVATCSVVSLAKPSCISTRRAASCFRTIFSGSLVIAISMVFDVKRWLHYTTKIVKYKLA